MISLSFFLILYLYIMGGIVMRPAPSTISAAVMVFWRWWSSASLASRSFRRDSCTSSKYSMVTEMSGRRMAGRAFPFERLQASLRDDSFSSNRLDSELNRIGSLEFAQITDQRQSEQRKRSQRRIQNTKIKTKESAVPAQLSTVLSPIDLSISLFRYIPLLKKIMNILLYLYGAINGGISS